MLDLTQRELRFALEAVAEAVELARRIRSEIKPDSLQKSDRSPVTVADYSIQALIAHRLEEAFPGDVLVAEEDSHEVRKPQGRGVLEQVVSKVRDFLSDADGDEVCRWIDRGTGDPQRRFWTLDPVDGTKGFLRGGHYAVALALLEQGRVCLGVLGCPHWRGNRDWVPEGPGGIVVALRGQGAWWRPVGQTSDFIRLRVSKRRQVSQARLLRSYESGHTNEDKMALLARLLEVQTPPLSMDSQAKYAVLASGQGDLLLRLLRRERPDYREKVWDQAAGSIVVEEAGGRITDLEGRALDFTAGRTLARNRGILASNGLLHEEGLAALARLERASQLEAGA